MPSLTFYGGVNEIGGNKILVEDKDTKILLDFGKSFTKYSKYFQDFLKPRTSNGIVDYIEMGLIPYLDGLYRTDLLEMGGLRATDPDIDAVILTHAHADHANHISFLHEDIPVYMGETAHMILKALEERASREMESEILSFKRRPLNKSNEIMERNVRTFRTGDKIKIGSIEVEPVHVDHSIPGAYGLIVHTSEGSVVYSGDVRLHGTRPEMTREFVERAAASKPIALVMEGTRIKEEKISESESKVRDECNSLVKEAKSLVIADFSFKDVDRLRTFYTIAKENNRKLVVNLKDAFLLKWLSRDPQLKVPPYDDPDIIIYKPKKQSGTYVDRDYSVKEREFLNNDNVWTAREIKENQRNVLCAMTMFQFDELIDIKPNPGSILLFSTSEPHNEEQEFDHARLVAWTEHFGLRMFSSHCSGHAYAGDLRAMVKQIDAEKIFPVHTERPDLLKQTSESVIIVEEAKTYRV